MPPEKYFLKNYICKTFKKNTIMKKLFTFIVLVTIFTSCDNGTTETTTVTTKDSNSSMADEARAFGDSAEKKLESLKDTAAKKMRGLGDTAVSAIKTIGDTVANKAQRAGNKLIEKAKEGLNKAVNKTKGIE